MQKNWIEVTLEDVKQDSLIGLVRSSSEQNNSSIGVPYLKMNNIDLIGNVQLSGLIYVEALEDEIEKYSLKYGDILINTRNSFELVGKSGIVRKQPRNVVFNNNIMRIRVKKEIDNFFIAYQLISPLVRGQMEKQKKATTSVCALYQRNLFPLKLSLPPLPEQRAIVARIEELFSELDHAIADLKSAQSKLEIYRQAVLKKAFEGGFSGESSSSWEIKKTKEVCENIKVGIVIQPKKFYTDDKNGIKAFRSANVREFKINDSNWVYFSESGNKENNRTQLKEGDVLIVRSGYPGTSCVVSKKYEGSNAIDILIATPNKDLILPEYLCAFNNSPLGKGLFEEGARGVAQKHLNVGVYSNLELPIPSTNSQQKVLEEIESRLSVADKLAETIQTNLEKAESLRQSILKKAFEGELLTEVELEACRKEGDWEPAKKLLERINIKNMKNKN